MNFIQKVCDSIAKEIFPLQFTPEKWRDCYKHTNCYAYAINSRVVNHDTCAVYDLGGFYNLNQGLILMTKLQAEAALYKDLTLIGLKADKVKYSQLELPNENHYNICLFIKNTTWYNHPYTDFHFVRQDIDGSWSHKMGRQGLPEQLTSKSEKPHLIIKYSGLGYTLVGYYSLSKV